MRLAMNPMTGVLIRRQDTERHRDDGHRKWAMQPQARGFQEPPDAGRGRGGSSFRASGGRQLCRHRDFRLLASRTVRG